MKQVLIRILSGINTVYDVVYGRLEDGSFNIASIDDTEFPIPPYVHCDDLLGGTSFIKAEDLPLLISYYTIRSQNIRFYPNMLVFTLESPDHESKEED